MTVLANPYPVTFEVDYPERQSRWKTLFRPFLALPIFLLLAILSGGGFTWLSGRWWNAAQAYPEQISRFSVGAGGVIILAIWAAIVGAIILAIWAAIVIRGYIPRWFFNFQVSLMRFQARAYGYLALLTDIYPPFEGEYPISLEVQYPERLSRWKVLLWKLITAIPHFVVLPLLWIAAALSIFVSWLVILFSGSCPCEIHQFIVGVMRWSLRVQAYVLSLTDEYPPFSLSAEAGPAGKDTYVVASVIGNLLAVAFVVGLAALGVLIAHGLAAEKMRVSYDSLLQGHVDPKLTSVVDKSWDVRSTLEGAVDPANELVPVLSPAPGRHFVAFKITIEATDESPVRVAASDFRLKDSGGHSHKPVLVTADGRIPPIDIDPFSSADSARVVAIFEIADDLNPTQLLYARPLLQSWGYSVIYEFE